MGDVILTSVHGAHHFTLPYIIILFIYNIILPSKSNG